MLLISLVTASNSYPIILVHGFIGWGRDEMNGYYYWGGQMDLESYLKKWLSAHISNELGDLLNLTKVKIENKYLRALVYQIYENNCST